MKIHTDTWVDVFQYRTQPKENFTPPTDEELHAIQPNDTVKISNGTERFFVWVNEINKDKIIGTIDNHLICESPYNFGDKVEFNKKHVYSVSKSAKIITKPVSKKTKTTIRMMKMLGLDPHKSHEEEKVFDALFQ